jgi:ubiquinone biosynthesis protein
MLPLARQARYLGRYRQIAQVLGQHGFGYVLEQLGLLNLLSLPRRVILRRPPPRPVGAGARLTLAMIDLGPTFIKLGQLLSTRPDLLPPELLAELDRLQDTVPPFPGEQAVEIIETELGRPIHELFIGFELKPLAAASLGQVHTAYLRNGEAVVVKVQRPGIASTINTDLAIISDLAALAQERTDFGQQYDLVDLAWELSTLLRREIDFTNEGLNADRFRHNFEDNHTVHIPKIHWDYTTRRVLTSERLFGIKINQVAALDAAGANRPQLARHSLQLILEEVFDHGFFHADPHPGNIFALPNNVIGVVDFGQVGTLGPDATRQLLLLLVSMINRDGDGATRAMMRLGMFSRYDITMKLRRDIQRFIDRYVDRSMSELSFTELSEELFGLSRRHQLTMPSQIALLLKTLIMTEGTGRLLDPDLDIFGIARPYANQALRQQYSPYTMAQQAASHARDLAETSIELPDQLATGLQRLNAGKLRIQTHEQELRRLAAAQIGAANRIAVALVLGALIISIGLLAIALSMGQWSGTLILIVVAGISTIITALALLFALLRGRNV